jgi:hypothetical protein
MKTFGLAALILVLAGSSFALAKEVPTPAAAEEPSGQPRVSPGTSANKTLRRPMNAASRSAPVEIFSPLPPDPDIDVTEHTPDFTKPVKPSN